MDETSYSDDEVIRLINESFVPIRVDNDQRPDVNARYNMGGWPTTVFLTPDGDILHGGTYLPPEMMRSLLAQIADFYAEPSNRLGLSKRVAEIRARRSAPVSPTSAPLDPETARNVMAALERSFDEEYGGFGDEPKFPQVNAIHFLLDYYARHGDERAREMARKSLHGMAGGGMYDHIEGGFFRYSTTRDWSIPHYEKMLEDLSGLLLACARASVLFGDADLRAVAVDVKRYVDATLWNGEFGGYGGSQDADETYYLCDAAGRSNLAEPYVDPILYASWNAEMARAQIVSARLLGGEAASWTADGVRLLDTLWSKLLVDGLMTRYFDGTPHVRGLLGDQAWCAYAALTAFSATSSATWLARARELIKATGALFVEGTGLYRDRLPDPSEPGRVSEPSSPIEENALMARVLMACAAFTGDRALAERANGVLSRFASGYSSLGPFAAGYASAVLDALEPPVDAHVVGPARADATQAMRDAALSLPAPPVRVDVVDPERDSTRLQTLGYDRGEQPVAYLCRSSACFARVTTAYDLKAALSEVGAKG